QALIVGKSIGAAQILEGSDLEDPLGLLLQACQKEPLLRAKFAPELVDVCSTSLLDGPIHSWWHQEVRRSTLSVLHKSTQGRLAALGVGGTQLGFQVHAVDAGVAGDHLCCRSLGGEQVVGVCIPAAGKATCNLAFTHAGNDLSHLFV